MNWRVGRHQRRNIYCGNDYAAVAVGSDEVANANAALIVATLNVGSALLERYVLAMNALVAVCEGNFAPCVQCAAPAAEWTLWPESPEEEPASYCAACVGDRKEQCDPSEPSDTIALIVAALRPKTSGIAGGDAPAERPAGAETTAGSNSTPAGGLEGAGASTKASGAVAAAGDGVRPSTAHLPGGGSEEPGAVLFDVVDAGAEGER